MATRKINYFKYFFILLIDISIITISDQSESIYTFPIGLLGQNNLPMVQVHFQDYNSLPRLMMLDINSHETFSFNSGESAIINTQEIIEKDFYKIKGSKSTSTVYLNPDLKIEGFNYFKILQINGKNIFPEILSLNKMKNEYNFATKIKYSDNNIIDDKYFGFCLDFSNKKNDEAKLSIGKLSNLNSGISKLIKLPLFPESDEKKQKWAVNLKGLFIGSLDTSITDKITIEKENREQKIIYNLNKIYNKGVIIEEPANLETKYNSIYISKEAMLFLNANYFKNHENICFRKEFVTEEDYEIKFDCLKKEKSKLMNINLVFDNNVTVELTPDDLLNCAINENLDNKENENEEMCEFNIKYNNKINQYSLGLPLLKKYKTYFLYNDNSILLEGNQFPDCYLKEDIYSNISRHKKKSTGDTIKELFNTTLCISLIFAFLAGAFYGYERFYGEKKSNKLLSKSEQAIHKEKYVNL